MRTIDDTNRTVGQDVACGEEALVALSQALDRRFERGLSGGLWSYEQPGDDASDGDDAERRTVRDVAAEAAVLDGALRPLSGWGRRMLTFDRFTATDVANWPVKISELRRDAALADADLDALAAHLNARMRGDVARVLRDCADFGSPRRNVDSETPDERETVWDHFQRYSDIYDLSLGEAVEAIAAGPTSWETLDDWTPAGGVNANPYTVCRYAWGPLRAHVELQARELLEAYLAGDAELALRRIVIDVGEGPTEIIWPEQARTCCGYPNRSDELPPIRINRAHRPDVQLYAGTSHCRVCITRHYGSILTCRPVHGDAATPLGATETIDALPADTLTAIARDGAAVACDLPR